MKNNNGRATCHDEAKSTHLADGQLRLKHIFEKVFTELIVKEQQKKYEKQ